MVGGRVNLDEFAHAVLFNPFSEALPVRRRTNVPADNSWSNVLRESLSSPFFHATRMERVAPIRYEKN
jgi:hypothetical protein